MRELCWWSDQAHVNSFCLVSLRRSYETAWLDRSNITTRDMIGSIVLSHYLVEEMAHSTSGCHLHCDPVAVCLVINSNLLTVSVGLP